jgi:hypothetical protein
MNKDWQSESGRPRRLDDCVTTFCTTKAQNHPFDPSASQRWKIRARTHDG